jgi:hypothetical protein
VCQLGDPGSNQGCQISIPKRKKYTTKFTNWLLKRLKDGKIFPMAMKSTNIFYFLARKFYENCDFWIENIPSGNPGSKVKFLQ